MKVLNHLQPEIFTWEAKVTKVKGLLSPAKKQAEFVKVAKVFFAGFSDYFVPEKPIIAVEEPAKAAKKVVVVLEVAKPPVVKVSQRGRVCRPSTRANS